MAAISAQSSTWGNKNPLETKAGLRLEKKRPFFAVLLFLCVCALFCVCVAETEGIDAR